MKLLGNSTPCVLLSSEHNLCPLSSGKVLINDGTFLAMCLKLESDFTELFLELGMNTWWY